MHFLTGLVIAVLTLFLLRYLKWIGQVLFDIHRRWQCTRHMGGPETLPLIGSAHKLMGKSSYETVQYLVAEAKKVTDSGGSMMKIWLGPKMDIWVLNSESAKDILSSATEITKGPAYAFFSRWLGTGLLIGNGDHWRKMRKMITPTFHFGKVEEYAQTMDHHVRIMIELLSKKPQNTEINLYSYIKYCALDIIADTAMAFEMNAQKDNNQPYPKAVEVFSHLGWIQFQNPHYQLFGKALWRLLGYEAKTAKTLQTLKSLSREIVRRRIEMLAVDLENEVEMEEKRRHNFLDMMLEHQTENRLTMDQLCAEVDTFVFAGHDTTTHAVAWTIWCLATHPDLQKRLYDELCQEFGCSDVEFWTKRIEDLPYLNAVFRESLRLFPPVPFVQRWLEEDLEIDGHTIPRHTCILIPPCLMHQNEKVFPNPTRYDPDRFISGVEFSAYSYIPFLAGPRNCIGQRFALRESKIMIAHLVYNYELTSDHKLEENLPIPETILRPSLGIPVKMKFRQL